MEKLPLVHVNRKLHTVPSTELGFAGPSEDWFDHPNGSMFWARTAALAPLLDLNLQFEDFGDELRQYNGTLAHGVEFSYFFTADLAGYKGLRVGRAGDPDAPAPAATPAELAAQLDRALAAWPPG